MYGLLLSVRDESPDYPEAQLRVKLELALALIRAHAPIWIDRMLRCGVEIHVERTPGTRAKLLGGRTTVLDSYFVAAFLPAQIASSIVHETVHALVRAWGIRNSVETIAREERLCRKAELRFGKALLAGRVQGAQAVVDRAEESLTLSDDDIAPAVDWRRLAELQRSSRPVPRAT